MKYTPETDGVDHINIYSKGKTELGRMLSNFYKYRIDTEDGVFYSVEAYWAWLSVPDDCPERNELRKMYGYFAKKKGNELVAKYGKRFEPDFERKILSAIEKKFSNFAYLCFSDQNKAFEKLPLVHYYAYGEGRNAKIYDQTEKYKWMVDGIAALRDKYVAEGKQTIQQSNSL